MGKEWKAFGEGCFSMCRCRSVTPNNSLFEGDEWLPVLFICLVSSYPGYILASTCKEEQESLLLWTPFCFRGSQHHSGPVLLILKFLFQFSLESVTLLHSWVERGSIRKCGKYVVKPCWIISPWANQLVFFCSSHMCRLSTFLSSRINNCCGLCPLLPFPYLSCIILSRPMDTRGFPLLISNSLMKLSTAHHSCHYMGNTVTKGWYPYEKDYYCWLEADIV